MSRLRAWLTVNDVQAGASRAYPDLLPLRIDLTTEEAYRRAREAARSMPRWTIVAESAVEHRFVAEARTPVLRFVDDVVVWVVGEEDEAATGAPSDTGVSERPIDASLVHVRSSSRIGRGDFGTNARRIRTFLRAVAAAAGTAGRSA